MTDRLALKKYLPLVIAAFIGIFAVVGFRYIYVKPHKVHYHANFALFINGVQDKFDNPGYYEEVQGCWDEHTANPRERVHLHGPDSHVIHVHDDAVTWSNLFSNLGYGLTNTLIQTGKSTYIDGTDNKNLRFILNGKTVRSIANEIINSEDTLLIDYGNDPDSVLKARFEAIPHDADEFNQRNDPSTCTGSESETPLDRFKRALWK